MGISPKRLGLFLLIFFGFFAGNFLPNAEAADTYTGVGLLLDYDPPGSGKVTVYSVTYKSPADRAKIKRGDQLLQVDGKPVTGKPLQEIANWIRGVPGTGVTLTLLTAEGQRDFPLVRQQLAHGPIVSLPAPSQIGRGFYFSAEEKALVKAKILGLGSDEARLRMKQLILDLQDRRVSKIEFIQRLKTDFP